MIQSYNVYFKSKSKFNGKPMYISFHLTVDATSKADAEIKSIEQYKKTYCSNLPFEIVKIHENGDLLK
ncbi:hypothetical protein AST00_10730 [Staphylococcus equorum]|uniref:hypothetical protein n=1 Tax=Staphylococcus equorum TaxID=246432 RepID=UPI0008533707|nr:hypothetical protein [Staphylococcus equorum]OEK64378.1 hypothetical protein AST00_10730 [Staphylococcus equorum]